MEICTTGVLEYKFVNNNQQINTNISHINLLNGQGSEKSLEKKKMDTIYQYI